MPKRRYDILQKSALHNIPYKENEAKIVFDEPQRAITPGQAVIF